MKARSRKSIITRAARRATPAMNSPASATSADGIINSAARRAILGSDSKDASDNANAGRSMSLSSPSVANTPDTNHPHAIGAFRTIK